MYRIATSNLWEISTMKRSLLYANKIKNTVYSLFSGNGDTLYGHEHEVSAIQQFKEDHILKVSHL